MEISKLYIHDDSVSNLQNLPYEVITQIFSELSLHDISCIARTCKKFREIVLKDNALWKNKCKELFVVNDRFRNIRGCNFELSPYHQCRISTNWRKGCYKSSVIARTDVNYMPWLNLLPRHMLLSTGNMLTCYERNKTGLPFNKKPEWNVNTPRVPRRGVRTNDISRFVVKDGVIICGNRDGCVSVYKLMTNSLKRKPFLQDHIRDCHKAGSVEVSAVEYGQSSAQDPYVVSCSSDDDCVKIWTEREETSRIKNKLLAQTRKCFKCTSVISTHIYGAVCLSLDDASNRLAVGMKCNTRPLLIDIGRRTTLNDIGAHANRHECVRDIQWINRHTVAYVRHTGFLSAYDCRAGNVVYNVTDPTAFSLYSLQSDLQYTVVTGCAQLSRCVVYDIRQPRRFVQVIFTQRANSPVYSVGFDTSLLAAAADRGVAALNFNVHQATTQRRDYAKIINFFC